MKWLVLAVTILIFNSIAFLMRKRLKFSELYATVTFALVADTLSDLYASFNFKAWGFFEPAKAELTTMFIILGIYPAAAAMIINWYPYESAWWKKIIYLMCWSVFSTAYEWLTLVTGILWHKNWNLFYSFLIYPFIYYMLIVHIRIYRWWTAKNSTN